MSADSQQAQEGKKNTPAVSQPEPQPEPWRDPVLAGDFEPFPYQVRDRTSLGRYVIERAYLRTPQGLSPYSVVRCQPCVCVLVAVGRRVLLVRQYRYAVDSWQDELVAGGIEEGESPVQAALRELREETGYVVNDPGYQVVELGSFFPSAGSSDEIMHLVAVRLPEGARPGDTDFDRGERTQLVLLDRAQMERRMAQGSLVHSAIYVAWERMRLRGLLDEWFGAGE